MISSVGVPEFFGIAWSTVSRVMCPWIYLWWDIFLQILQLKYMCAVHVGNMEFVKILLFS